VRIRDREARERFHRAIALAAHGSELICHTRERGGDCGRDDGFGHRHRVFLAMR